MVIVTELPGELPEPAFAWAVATILNGIAVGIAPLMHAWKLPQLYESGVRYRLEPDHGSGVERFDVPPVCYARRWVDCDDAVIWRVAELVARDIQARAKATWEGDELHVTVRLPNGSEEDPSKTLAQKEGIPWPSRLRSSPRRS